MYQTRGLRISSAFMNPSIPRKGYLLANSTRLNSLIITYRKNTKQSTICPAEQIFLRTLQIKSTRTKCILDCNRGITTPISSIGTDNSIILLKITMTMVHSIIHTIIMISTTIKDIEIERKRDEILLSLISQIPTNEYSRVLLY